MNYEYKRILNQCEFNSDFSDICIGDILIELCYKNSIGMTKKDFMSTINILIDNSIKLSSEELIFFERILEEYELYAHKLKSEIISNNIIKSSVYEKIKLEEWHLTKEQYKLNKKVNSFLTNESNTFILSAPTSFGKSFIITNLLKSFLHKKFKVLIMLPNKSLINEYYMNFKDTNIRVTSDPFVCNEIDEACIFIGTPERVLLLNEDKYNFVLIDDIYFTGNFKDREKSFVLALKKLENNKKMFIVPNINVESVEQILKDYDISLDGCIKQEFKQSESPVSNSHFYLNISTMESKKSKLCLKDQVSEIDHIISDDSFVSFANCLNKINEKSLIYEGCLIYHAFKPQASKILNILKTHIFIEPNINNEVDILIRYIEENSHPHSELIDFLRTGKCIHNGDLDEFTREMIELLFRQNVIKIIFATSTLSKGVNLPCKNIFFITKNHTLSKFNDIDIKNTLGRAGRFKTYNHANRIIVNMSQRASINDALFAESSIEKQAKLEPGIKKIDNDIKKVLEEDKRFSIEFKKNNEIQVKDSSEKSYVEYLLGYEKNDFLVKYITRYQKDINNVLENLFSYKVLLYLLNDINTKYRAITGKSFFWGSVKYKVYIYMSILEKTSIKELIVKNSRENRVMYTKNNKILFKYEGDSVRVDYNNKKHINNLIYYYLNTYSEIQYEMRAFLLNFMEILKNVTESKSEIDFNNILQKVENDTLDEVEIQLKNLGVRHKFLINNIVKKSKELNININFKSGKELKLFVEEHFEHSSPEYFSVNELHYFNY